MKLKESLSVKTCIFSYLVILIFAMGCHYSEIVENDAYVYKTPNYSAINIQITRDTMIFPLQDGVLPKNPFFNCRLVKGNEYISFTDNLTHTINVYDLEKRTLVKQVKIPRNDNHGNRIGECSAWFRDFDSIYLCNHFYLVYRMDSAGIIHEAIDLSAISKPVLAGVGFLNYSPPFFKNGEIVAAAYPYLPQDKLSEIYKWPVLNKFNIIQNKNSLLYKLPSIYKKKLYGLPFLFSYYCINDLQQFVFSFPADPAVYVYNPENIKENCSYFGNSTLIQDSILSVPESELKSGETLDKAFLMRNSYGPIYYDSFRKRYLRVAETKLSKEQLKTKNWVKEQSIIVFDETFNIIGESKIDKNIDLRTLFITSNGIFARNNFIKDENNLYFSKLDYFK